MGALTCLPCCVVCCDPNAPYIFLRLSGIFQCPSRDEHVNGDWVCSNIGPGNWGGVAGTSTILVQCDGTTFSVQVYDIGNSFLGSSSPPTTPLFNTASCALGDDGEGGTATIIGCTVPSDQTGACCQGETCSNKTQELCLADGGIFMGVGIPCSSNPCNAHGACCYNDGSCPSGAYCLCIDLSPDDCAAMGGRYTWNTLPCIDIGGINTCPVGACCAAELGCIPALLSFCGSNCTGSGRNCVSLGPGTQCPGSCGDMMALDFFHRQQLRKSA